MPRELLELAAEAAGYAFAWVNDQHLLLNSGEYWNPITDDGDALRLAVKLRKLPVIEKWSDGHERVFIPGHEDEALPLGNDPLAATRRAIVRAAAEIGRQIK